MRSVRLNLVLVALPYLCVGVGLLWASDNLLPVPGLWAWAFVAGAAGCMSLAAWPSRTVAVAAGTVLTVACSLRALAFGWTCLGELGSGTAGKRLIGLGVYSLAASSTFRLWTRMVLPAVHALELRPRRRTRSQ